jgi:GTP cyclohydrolase FolE2
VKDIQNSRDDRQVEIDEVGVTRLRYPITVLDPERGKQETVAELTLPVSLPHHFRGTHMSRFIEVLNAHRGEMTMRTLPRVLEEPSARIPGRHGSPSEPRTTRASTITARSHGPSGSGSTRGAASATAVYRWR